MVGSSYCLRRSTCAVTDGAPPQHILKIPDGAIVTVLKAYRNNGHDMLTVEWNHANVSIFAVDLEQRGELVAYPAIAKGA